MKLQDTPAEILHEWQGYRIVNREGFSLRLEYWDGEGWAGGGGNRLLMLEVSRLARENQALRNDHDQGLEIQAELTAALAGLAGEPLRSCSGSCPGRMGPRASKLFSEGLRAYEGLGE